MKEFEMEYNLNANGASHRRCISGASLAQLVRKMPPAARAILAADILDGRVVLVGLTRKTVTALCGADPGYVAAALRTTPEQRVAIVRGHRSLVQTRPRAAAPAFWAGIDDGVLEEAVRRVAAEHR
jgi:hypothetical protein